ncbi:CopG domain protein DNA-binding domain protein [Pyrobaculum islandicum DSM 4184]|uniref:CopG domain protein DNA-binding domain protein n=1 Tax=Pyrobaculum islandicum (strain DSM 4184 / JCM 9189 / GEO3) TaxID=384616 RepID=A1RS68_PYRIL|nr:ribbon-helix-helix protein, CopG family [Pyrobaculum islandicum]ABL87800.1 CopG domain protein DNA-binding domain protein [Pyrobaculum islandicum DSM 4184]
MSIPIREFDLTYNDLFRAPDKEGAVVSVRVHRKVKRVLEELAKREGLDGVSELVRYLIAGYLMGKYNIEKPREKVIVEPIVLTINVQKNSSKTIDDVELDIAAEKIVAIIRDVEDYLRKVKAGIVPRNPEVAMRLHEKLANALKTAKKLGMEEEYMKLIKLKAQLSAIE